ncbi:ABC transporter permease subunit [Frankia sp. AgB32]|uniref:ABC transporter permease subunit n=1 Tax=Frankia sp. AgB32 TaxID=631119 RepID=UPI00200E8175|nr:ABC transporter permease subunit [Frankia sp. AgB32]MCK9898243.1 ABC transporter permease [Frankia sp. AgB32]
MIWLTWRQLRVQAATILGALAVLAVGLAATGPRLAHLSAAAADDFLDQAGNDRADSWVYLVGVLAVLALPAIIGVFWGAPLVARELDAGTHQLAWNQSVTRTRWLVTKLGLTGLGAMVATGALSLAVTWWCAPIDRAVAAGHGNGGLLTQARMLPPIFDARGIVPIGYAAFAFALGVAVGILVRRTVPAMAVTLAVFIAVQIAVPLLVRPHLVAPSRSEVAITGSTLQGFRGSGPPGPGGHIDGLMVEFDRPGAWRLSAETVDADGHVVRTLSSSLADCMPPPVDAPPSRASVTDPRQACATELAARDYRQRFTYQPASHYWPLQGVETGMYLAVALGLAGLSCWRIRRLS